VGVSRWVARREVERVNRRFRNALGLDRDYSTDEWRELNQEWQDRALLAKASKWLRHSKTGNTRSIAKRRMVASVRESVERSVTLRSLRISERQAARKTHAPKAKPERERQASADHLATEVSGEEPSPAEALKEAAEEKQVYARKDEERVEASEEVREEGTIHAEVIDDSFEDASTKQSGEKRRKRTLIGFLFRMVVPTFATLLLLLYLCDILNQHMGWNIPLGLGVVGISTTDDAKESEEASYKLQNELQKSLAEITRLQEELTGKKEWAAKDEPSRGGGAEYINNLLLELNAAKLAISAPAPDVETSGKAFTIRDLGLDMLWVKPGTFTMGSPTTEAGREKDETQHQVTLTNGFYLGKHEVTQAQWEKVAGSNPSRFKGVNRPVEQVSWDELTSFCEKLTELERKAGRLPAGMAYQLPTEAQWEYACRAGTKTAYSFGDELTAKDANFDKNMGETTDVGKYPANAWGFHDMHGNVWEWTADWYGDYPTGTVSDSVGPVSGSDRVVRGASWYITRHSARSANRARIESAFSDNNLGFRLSLRPASN
jgi:formylglycine-generating enzyme